MSRLLAVLLFLFLAVIVLGAMVAEPPKAHGGGDDFCGVWVCYPGWCFRVTVPFCSERGADIFAPACVPQVDDCAIYFDDGTRREDVACAHDFNSPRRQAPPIYSIPVDHDPWRP